MRRLVTGILFSAALALPASAQTIESGKIVLLRSNSGKYLSAAPGQRLYLSPNKSAWEQWTYTRRGEGPLLTSFHGTIATLIDLPLHVPYLSTDPGLFMDPLVKSASGDVWTQKSGDPANGDVVLLQVGSTQSVLAEDGDAVVRGNHYFLAPVEANARWTVIIVDAPAANRTPRVRSMTDKSAYYLKSTHGTYLTYDQVARDAQGAWVPVVAIHRAGTQLLEGARLQQQRTYTSTGPLRFGDAISMTWRSSTVTLQPQDASNRAVVETYAGGSTPPWNLVDPTGIYKAGDRIPLGAKFCLRSSGGALSADPAFPALKLSPNCSGWEWWTGEMP